MYKLRMNPKQRAAFERLAAALQESREALYEVIKSSGDVIRVADDANEAANTMQKMLERISDDANPECSSGLLCELYEAVESVQPKLDKLTAAAKEAETPRFRTQAECMMTHHHSQQHECSSCQARRAAEKQEPLPGVLIFGFPPVNP